VVAVRNGGEEGREFAAYGVVLVALVGNPRAPEASYWICEGADIVFADQRSGIAGDEAVTTARFPGEVDAARVDHARLVLVSTAASGEGDDRNAARFNTGEWENPLSGGSSGISIADLDVTQWVRERDNTAEVASIPVRDRGDYMENRNAVLIVTYGDRAVSPRSGDSYARDNVPPPHGARTSQNLSRAGERNGFLGTLIEGVFSAIFMLLGVPHPAGGGIQPGPRVPPPAAPEPEGIVLEEGLGGGGDTHPRTEPGAPGAAGEPRGGDGEDSSPGGRGTGEGTGSGLETPGDLVPGGGEKRATGGIYVTSYPRGATVSIDGRRVLARTPVVANWLKTGMHTVRVELEEASFSPESRQVWVSAGEITPVQFSTGGTFSRTITFNSSDFAGALLSVNGIGPLLPLPARVTVEGHTPFVTAISDGKFYSVPVPPSVPDGSFFTLARAGEASGAIMVTSSPPGARIVVDGFSTGTCTPAVVGNLSPGQHRVTVSLPGFVPAGKVVTLVDFPREPVDMTVDFVLQPYPWGNLTIESHPQGARVYVFGKDTGKETPARFDFLQIGTVKGKLRWEDAEKEFEGEVLPGRDVVIRVQGPAGMTPPAPRRN
ncbi:MAG: PEGA domain-containing protein, partial [Methanolinea sp.]